MSAPQTFVVRISIVLGMVAAVVTILYFTPMPERYFLSCDRPCHALDWPMICRIKLILEPQQILSSTCQKCSDNHTCDLQHCYKTDKIENVLTVNRILPGPSIQVCQNDILVVDIINRIPGKSLTIHWRGQTQHEAPTMDGVPMVTQCPIPSYTTFQYKFRASNAGTHIWHSFGKSAGIFGALIVRQADALDPQRKLYDVDDKHHVVFVSEFGSTLLINGLIGNETAEFKVQKGKRYRFRFAYAGSLKQCPISISVEQHPMKVITVDGNPINPMEITTLDLASGERSDIVFKASKNLGSYKMSVKSECGQNAEALITYSDTDDKVQELSPNITNKFRKFTTEACESGLGKVCIGNVQNLEKLPAELRKAVVGSKLYLNIDKFEYANMYSLKSRIQTTNNISFMFPSSPLLTQREDIHGSILCNQEDIPDHCKDKDVCECVHIEYIPLGNAVEIVLVNQGNHEKEHVFHLHGYSFYIVGFKSFNTRTPLSLVKSLDSEGKLFERNLISPARKDTVRVPQNSAVAIRFLANNPGFWLLRDEHSSDWTNGLDLVLQIGKPHNLVPTPTGFPKCGSWIGPDFFLL